MVRSWVGPLMYFVLWLLSLTTFCSIMISFYRRSEWSLGSKYFLPFKPRTRRPGEDREHDPKVTGIIYCKDRLEISARSSRTLYQIPRHFQIFPHSIFTITHSKTLYPLLFMIHHSKTLSDDNPCRYTHFSFFQSFPLSQYCNPLYDTFPIDYIPSLLHYKPLFVHSFLLLVDMAPNSLSLVSLPLLQFLTFRVLFWVKHCLWETVRGIPWLTLPYSTLHDLNPLSNTLSVISLRVVIGCTSYSYHWSIWSLITLERSHHHVKWLVGWATSKTIFRVDSLTTPTREC